MSRADAARALPASRAPASQRDARAQILRFDASVRARVEALSRAHAYFEDLLWSFPAALVALARDEPCPVRAADAATLVRAGAPLAAIARALDIPLWLRVLPPEAYRGAIPKLPDGADFAQRITNFLPGEAQSSARWLAFVAAVDTVCDESFALWAAQRFAQFDAAALPDEIAGIGLFAWFSSRPGLEASALMLKPFTAEAEPREAVTQALDWLEHLEFPLNGAPRIALSTDCALIDEFEFIQLRTAEDVLEEAQNMHNCLGTYAGVLAHGRDQVWSVRKSGVRIACLHIQFEDDGGGVPVLVQIKDPHNIGVEAPVLRASYRWPLSWPEMRVRMADVFRGGAATHVNYRRLMKPYWLAKGRRDWLPIADIAEPFSQVRAGLWALENPARRARNRRRRR